MLRLVICLAAVVVAAVGDVAAFLPPLTFSQGQLWAAAGGWFLLTVAVSVPVVLASACGRWKMRWLLTGFLLISLALQTRDLRGVLRDRLLEEAGGTSSSNQVLLGSVTWGDAHGGTITIAAADGWQGEPSTVWRQNDVVVHVRTPVESLPLTDFGDDTEAALFLKLLLGDTCVRVGALNLGVTSDQESFTRNRLTARRLATQMRQGDEPALVVGQISTTASSFECRILSELPDFSFFSGRRVVQRIVDLPFGECLTGFTLLSRGLAVTRDPENPFRLLLYAGTN